jgi:hypothetical protein
VAVTLGANFDLDSSVSGSVVSRCCKPHDCGALCPIHVVQDDSFIMPSGREVSLFVSPLAHASAPITTEYMVAAGTMTRPTRSWGVFGLADKLPHTPATSWTNFCLGPACDYRST